MKLQLPFKKPSELRIRSLLNVFVLPTMATSQKIQNVASETLNLVFLRFRLIKVNFQVILWQNTATPSSKKHTAKLVCSF